MPFMREFNRLLIGFLIAFVLTAFAAVYWAVMGPEDLLNRDDNPRLVEARASIQRGSIYDSNDTLLAHSTTDENGILQRAYFQESTFSTIGYYSFRYGVGGAESVYDSILNGDDLPADLTTFIEQDLLHLPAQGSDIRLTLDTSIQKLLVNAMQDYRGAAVLLRVNDGAVLSLVSMPAYDPNTLDADWETLVEDPRNPFFNRALQGAYQPGGTFQTASLISALLAKLPLDTVFEDATQPVQHETLEIACTFTPPSNTLTLAEAYKYGCPAPFMQIADKIKLSGLQQTITTLKYGLPATLPRFVNEDTSDVESIIQSETLGDLVLGQGSITVNVMDMVATAAAIQNEGKSPQPYLLQSVRRPKSDLWGELTTARAGRSLMSAAVAEQIKSLMLNNLNHTDIGGHSAIAYSGEETLAWFIGFAATETGGYAIAVVLEDTDDALNAQQIGVSALEATVNTAD